MAQDLIRRAEAAGSFRFPQSKFFSQRFNLRVQASKNLLAVRVTDWDCLHTCPDAAESGLVQVDSDGILRRGPRGCGQGSKDDRVVPIGAVQSVCSNSSQTRDRIPGPWPGPGEIH